MAGQQDTHPDFNPSATSDSPQKERPEQKPRRDGAGDAPGDFAGTAGTGGENKVQDAEFER